VSGVSPKVAIVGYGRAGGSLAKALRLSGAKIVNIGEHPDSQNVARAVDDGFRVLPVEHLDTDVDLLVVAVPDTEIENVAGVLAESAGAPAGKRNAGLEREKQRDFVRTAMHLSGRLGLEPLNSLGECGFARLAWHPIQTFPSGADESRFRGITAGVTADDEAMPVARWLCESLDVRMLEVPENRRVDYHLASVLASNFLPLLLDLGADRLQGIAPDRETAIRALWPLVAGMTESLGGLPPERAVTGPVVRNDLEGVKAHLAAMQPDLRSLYKQLTLALVDMAHRNGALNDEQVKSWVRELGNGNGRSGGVQ
jgi:predicted short-subunit dehydrogenase-like oxidoreductase (DUF2520 family)